MREEHRARLIRQITILLPVLIVCGGGLLRCSEAMAASLRPMQQRNAAADFDPGSGCVVYSALVFNTGADGQSRPVDGHSLTPARFYRAKYDSGGFWNPANPARLTAPVDGLYAIRLRVNFELSMPAPPQQSVGRRLVFALNGTPTLQQTYDDPRAPRGYWPTLQQESLLKMNAGQFVEVMARASAELPGELNMAGVDLSIRRLCD